MVGGLAHVAKVGYYLNGSLKVGVWIVYSSALVILLLWVRFVKPLQEYRRPWRVARVELEADRACTPGARAQQPAGDDVPARVSSPGSRSDARRSR